MTTGKSSAGNLFLSLLRKECRRYLWTLAVMGIIYAGALPIQMSLVYERYASELYNISKEANILSAFIAGNDFLFLGTAGSAVFLALMMYRFLFSKSRVDFYFSLPVTRSMQFFCRYLCGFLHFLTVFTLFYGLAIFYGIAKGAPIIDSIGILFAFYLAYILLFAAIYTFSIIAGLFAGNMLMALINISLLFAAGPGIQYMLEALGSYYYATRINLQPPLFESRLSILTLGISFLKAMQTKKTEAILMAAVLFAVTFTGILAAHYLFRVRPADRNSSGMVYSKIAVLQTCTISLTGGLMIGLMLFELSYQERPVWLYAGAAAGTVLFHWIAQAAIENDFGVFSRRKWAVLGNLCIILLLISIYRFDLTGYDRYLPKKESVESAGILFTELDNYGTESGGVRSQLLQDSLLFSDYQTYELQKAKRLKEMRIENVSAVYDMAEHLISNPEEEEYDRLYIAWHLKNGRTVYREYPFAVRKHTEFYGEILKDDDYLKNIYPILGNTEQENDIKLSECVMQEDIELNASNEWKGKLLETYKKELFGIRLDDLLGEEPAWMIRVGADSGDYSYYPVYPSFQKTIAMLKEYGCTFDSFKNHAERLLLYYEPETDGEGQESFDFVITDSEVIAQIMPHLVPMYYISSGISLKQEEKGFAFNVYIDTKDRFGYVQEDVVSCYIEEGVFTEELYRMLEENMAEN